MLSLTKAGRNLTRSQIDGLPYTGVYLPYKKIDCKRGAMKAKRNGYSPSPKTTLPFQVGAVEEQKKKPPVHRGKELQNGRNLKYARDFKRETCIHSITQRLTEAATTAKGQ